MILLLLVGANSFSQKKNGSIFSEHEYIDITRALWQAMVNGEEETYRNFFADSAYTLQNDQREPIMPNEKIGSGLADWVSAYENLKVGDYKPALPDAMEYKEGGTWVQDWLLMTGIHKETGMNLDLPIHNLYAFNEEGKITALISYFDPSIFTEIKESQTKKLNGKVYINHPYILSVRKGMNAFVAKDMEKWSSFYAPKAVFSNSSMQVGKYMNMEENQASMAALFFKEDLKFKVEQMGYPDCIYYEKNDMYVVYSWWKMMYKKDGKVYEYSFMLSHDFNDEGLIAREHIYMSSNHLDNLR